MINDIKSPSPGKVLFSYPTLLKEGMGSVPVYTPEPLIAGVSKGSVNSLVITAGLMLENSLRIYTEVDVLFNGTGVVMGTETAGKVENPMRHYLTHTNQVIYLSSLFVGRVMLPDSGTYEITVKLFTNDTESDSSRKEVDSFSSFFYALLNDEAENGNAI